jgi:hypothetical protein
MLSFCVALFMASSFISALHSLRTLQIYFALYQCAVGKLIAKPLLNFICNVSVDTGHPSES